MATGSKVGQQKGKDWEVVVPRYGYCDMEEENLEKVVAACKSACGAELKYYKDYAMQIKAELDKEIGPSWHVVVGKLHFYLCAFLNLTDYAARSYRNTFWFIRRLRTQAHRTILA